MCTILQPPGLALPPGPRTHALPCCEWVLQVLVGLPLDLPTEPATARIDRSSPLHHRASSNSDGHRTAIIHRTSRRRSGPSRWARPGQFGGGTTWWWKRFAAAAGASNGCCGQPGPRAPRADHLRSVALLLQLALQPLHWRGRQSCQGCKLVNILRSRDDDLRGSEAQSKGVACAPSVFGVQCLQLSSFSSLQFVSLKRSRIRPTVPSGCGNLKSRARARVIDSYAAPSSV